MLYDALAMLILRWNGRLFEQLSTQTIQRDVARQTHELHGRAIGERHLKVHRHLGYTRLTIFVLCFVASWSEYCVAMFTQHIYYCHPRKSITCSHIDLGGTVQITLLSTYTA